MKTMDFSWEDKEFQDYIEKAQEISGKILDDINVIVEREKADTRLKVLIANNIAGSLLSNIILCLLEGNMTDGMVETLIMKFIDDAKRDAMEYFEKSNRKKH